MATEREAIVRYIRGLAVGCRELCGVKHSEQVVWQGTFYADVAEEIEQGDHRRGSENTHLPETLSAVKWLRGLHKAALNLYRAGNGESLCVQADVYALIAKSLHEMEHMPNMRHGAQADA